MRQRWPRIPALILAGLNLLSIPFGTALGIYTFWVLLPSEHEQEYRELTQAVAMHMAHHRGQIEVYLRLKDIKPPDYKF